MIRDEAENLVNNFLVSRGYQQCEIKHEPDGIVPPDFLLNGKIAIKVTRLMQIDNNTSKNLNDLERKLHDKIKKILSDFGPPKSNVSWFVSYEFKRPMNIKKFKKEIARNLKNILETIKQGINLNRDKVWETDNFILEIEQSPKLLENTFEIGGYSDLDSGGCTLSEIEKSLQNILKKKSKKIEKNYDKYPEWDLFLVDHIGYARSNYHEKQYLNKNFSFYFQKWNKIYFVDPLYSETNINFELTPHANIRICTRSAEGIRSTVPSGSSRGKNRSL